MRHDLDLDQLIALLVGACLAAEHGNLDRGLQARALAIVFDGLRPQEAAELIDPLARGKGA